jgi:hypothetical protein
VKRLALFAIFACTSCIATSIGSVAIASSAGRSDIEQAVWLHYEDFVVGVDRATASKALEGDLLSSARIVGSLRQLHGDSPTISEYRRLFFWLEVDAQNGNLDSIIELATSSESTARFGCQRAKYWASIAQGRFPQYETALRESANPGQAMLVEQTVEMRRLAIKQAMRRVCADL